MSVPNPLFFKGQVLPVVQWYGKGLRVGVPLAIEKFLSLNTVSKKKVQDM